MSTNGVNFDKSLLTASQKTKFEKAKTDAEKVAIFQEGFKNEKLSKQEKDSLREKGITEAGINLLKKMEGGEAFLNTLAYAHLETDGDKPTFKGAEKLGDEALKQQIANFLITANKVANLDDIKKIPAATLQELGLTAEDLTQIIIPKLQQGANMVSAEFPANPAAGVNTATKVNIVVDDKKEIKVFNDTTAVTADNPTETLTFDPETGRYVRPAKDESGTNTYFALKEVTDENNNVVSRQLVDETGTVNQIKADIEGLSNQFTADEFAAFADELSGKTDAETKEMLQGKLQEKQQGQVDSLKAQLKETYGIEVAADDAELADKSLEEQINILNARVGAQQNKKQARDAFTTKGAKATIDEGTSKQRILAKQNWQGNIVVPKNATFDETTGLPSKVYVQLPDNYGFTPAEGQAPSRQFMSLKCTDAAKGQYTDARGLRTFTVEVNNEGKITFKENIDEGHDERIAGVVAQDRAIEAQLAAEHEALVKAVGGEDAEVANTSSLPWNKRTAARDAAYVAALESGLGDTRPEGYNAETMTVTQRRDALEAQYVETKSLTREGDTAASVKQEIIELENGLEARHDYNNKFAPTGRANGDLIMRSAAETRKAAIDAQDARFIEAPAGGKSPEEQVKEAFNITADAVKKDGSGNPEVTYSDNGQVQTLKMSSGDDIVCYIHIEDGPFAVERGDVEVYMDEVTIGERANNKYELVGKAYEAVFGEDASGPKTVKDLTNSITATTGVEFKMSQDPAHVDFRNRRAALENAGVNTDAISTVAALEAAEQNLQTNNQNYEANKAAIEERWAILTGAADSRVATDETTGTQRIIYIPDGRQEITLDNGNRVYVSFDSAGNISKIETKSKDSTNGYTDLVISDDNICYVPETYTDGNDTSVLISRTGTMHRENLYTLQAAIDYVKALAQANNFEIKKKEDEEGETPAT